MDRSESGVDGVVRLNAGLSSLIEGQMWGRCRIDDAGYRKGRSEVFWGNKIGIG